MKRICLFALVAACCLPALAKIEIVVGEPATAAVSQPFSVDFDAKGAMYGVEFTKSNRVYKFADGKLQFIAGAQHNSEKEKAQADVHDGKDPMRAIFHGMHDIHITLDGRAVIGDSFNNRVRLLDLASGKVSTLAGTGDAGFGGDGGPPSKASFSTAMTATLSPDQNRIYVADIG